MYLQVRADTTLDSRLKYMIQLFFSTYSPKTTGSLDRKSLADSLIDHMHVHYKKHFIIQMHGFHSSLVIATKAQV